MRKHSNQSGFTAVETVLILVILAIIGFTAYYVLHTRQNANQTLANSVSSGTTSTPYSGWKTYTNPGKTYSVEYPSGWSLSTTGAAPASATDVVGIGPKANSSLVTIASYASTDTPKVFLTNVQQATPLKDLSLKINGNSAYYLETGNTTNVDLGYAVSHGGNLVTISMSEKSASPTVDNTQYANQYNLIAKSVKML